MFTLSAMPVKFVCLLVLFSFTTVWEAWQVARSRDGRTGHAMHLLMSVLMLAMVPRVLWLPLHRVVPLPLMILVMAGCGGWFLAQSLRAHGHARRHGLACAGMFGAMVWHLWAMQVHMSHPMTMPLPAGSSSTPMPSSMPGMSMPGMDHGMNHSMEPAPMQPMPMDGWTTTASRPGHVLWWFAVVGLFFMAGLLWMAVRDVVAAVREPGHRAGRLAGFAMNFGMFWMSTGLMTPVLPWFRYLSF